MLPQIRLLSGRFSVVAVGCAALAAHLLWAAPPAVTSEHDNSMGRHLRRSAGKAGGVVCHLDGSKAQEFGLEQFGGLTVTSPVRLDLAPVNAGNWHLAATR